MQEMEIDPQCRQGYELSLEKDEFMSAIMDCLLIAPQNHSEKG